MGKRASVSSALVAQPRIVIYLRVVQVHILEHEMRLAATYEFANRQFIERMHDGERPDRGKRAHLVRLFPIVDSDGHIPRGHSVIQQITALCLRDDVIEGLARRMLRLGRAGLLARSYRDDGVSRVPAVELDGHVNGRLRLSCRGDHDEGLARAKLELIKQAGAQTFHALDGLVQTETIGAYHIRKVRERMR